MKQTRNRILSLLLVFLLVCSLVVPTQVEAAGREIFTTPTGYTKASDVVYKTSGKYIANWGARGEDCVFLSPKAESFYTGSYTYEKLSQNSGGTSQNDAKNSALYSALKSFMTSKHSHQTSYGETRDLYKYTDCVRNDTSKISSFYSGATVSGTWDSGSTWNREHTWPNSKGLNCKDEDDIMMLRPTKVSENSSRGNTAYGQSGSYYDPGVDVRGDCARIVLYVYVRWGNTGKMWGTGGVMENMNVLLSWMEQDPVDTWEMGRNDAVQAITGTRNVFVDYPEFAFQLFGKSVPSGMTTPSGGAGNGGGTTTCSHSNTEKRNYKAATCTEDGYTGDTYCTDCGKELSKGAKITAPGHKDPNNDGYCDTCNTKICAHSSTEVRNRKDATCTDKGYTGDTYCKVCGEKLSTGTDVAATGHKDTNKDQRCDVCGADLSCPHERTRVSGKKDATCTKDGYTGDEVCEDCGQTVKTGQTVPADHKDENNDDRCDVCDESLTNEPTEPVTQPTEPVTQPTEPATEATEPTGETQETEPTEETQVTEPTGETGTTEPSEPNEETQVTEPTETQGQHNPKPDDGKADDKKSVSVWVWVGVGVGVAAVGTVTVLLIVKKKKV